MIAGHTGALDIDEVHVVGSSVNHGPESHGVGDLSVEPDVLVSGEEPLHSGTDDTEDVAEHGNKDKATIVCENETGATGSPDRVCKTVESC